MKEYTVRYPKPSSEQFSVYDGYHPGEYLERLNDPHEKARRIVLCMAYLYMTAGDRDEQIKNAITSVAYMLEVKGLNKKFINVEERQLAAPLRNAEHKRRREETA
jgi:hypothetical protein